jgi:hypothetical protein
VSSPSYIINIYIYIINIYILGRVRARNPHISFKKKIKNALYIGVRKKPFCYMAVYVREIQVNPKFTCLTGTKVQILTLSRLPGHGSIRELSPQEAPSPLEEWPHQKLTKKLMHKQKDAEKRRLKIVDARALVPFRCTSVVPHQM